MSRKRLVLTAIVLVLILAIGGILAYFTDVQTKTNRFKTGEVKIEVTEPNFPGDPDDPTSKVPVTPNQEIEKDPLVTNKGDGEVYAFVEVTIPVANVKVGSATTAAPTQLFTTLKEDGTAGVNDGWVLVSQTPATADFTSSTTSVTYVYAYGTATQLTALTKNQATTKLFNKVKFADVTETDYSASGIQNSDFEVVVNGYGIQKDGLSSAKPSEVWPNVK